MYKSMDEFDIPIFKKSYDLYKTFYSYRNLIPKQDRYTIWQRCESLILDILEGILLVSQVQKTEKLSILEKNKHETESSPNLYPFNERNKGD